MRDNRPFYISCFSFLALLFLIITCSPLKLMVNCGDVAVPVMMNRSNESGVPSRKLSATLENSHRYSYHFFFAPSTRSYETDRTLEKSYAITTNKGSLDGRIALATGGCACASVKSVTLGVERNSYAIFLPFLLYWYYRDADEISGRVKGEVFPCKE
jgi:hypothetical protein